MVYRDLFSFLRLPQAVVAQHDAVVGSRRGFEIEGVVVGRGRPPENHIAAAIGVDAAARGAFASGFCPLVNELPDFDGEIKLCHRFTLL